MPDVFMFTVSFNPYFAEGGVTAGEMETQVNDLPRGHTANDRKLEFLPRSSSSSKVLYSFHQASLLLFLWKKQ